MRNYYIVIAVQRESDVQALEVATNLANEAGEFAELRRCGTHDLICTVSKEGGILMPKTGRVGNNAPRGGEVGR